MSDKKVSSSSSNLITDSKNCGTDNKISDCIIDDDQISNSSSLVIVEPPLSSPDTCSVLVDKQNDKSSVDNIKTLSNENGMPNSSLNTVDVDNLPYKELQQVAMKYNFPGNLKSGVLRELLRLRQEGRSDEVGRRLAAHRSRRRARNASAPQELPKLHEWDRRLMPVNASHSRRHSSSGSSRRGRGSRGGRGGRCSSSDRDPQWLPPTPRRRHPSPEIYYGVATSPTSIWNDSSNQSMIEMLSSEPSSRGTTPTMVRDLSPPARVASETQPHTVNPPQPINCNQTMVGESKGYNVPQKPVGMLPPPPYPNWSSQDGNGPKASSSTVGSSSSEAGGSQWPKMQQVWHQEYLRQSREENLARCLKQRAAHLHTTQGRVLEGSAFRYAPYQSHPTPRPHPPEVSSPQVSTTSHEHLENLRSQLLFNYLLNKNKYPPPPPPPTWPSATSTSSSQSWYQNQPENVSHRYPLLTQLLDREEMRRRSQQANFTATSQDVQQYDSRWNKVREQEAATQGTSTQTGPEGRSSRLVDMRNYPGNPLWKQFEFNKMQQQQQQQQQNWNPDVNKQNPPEQNWNPDMNNKQNRPEQNWNPDMNKQSSSKQNWNPEMNNKQNPPEQNWNPENKQNPHEQNWNSSAHNTPSQESYGGFIPPIVNPSSTTTIPPQLQAVNYTVNPSNVGEPTNQSPWFSDNNWIPSQTLPSYCYSAPLTSSTIEAPKPDDAAPRQASESDDENSDPAIPDDIEQQFDEAVAAQWGKDMPQLDENFLNAILNPAKTVACNYQLNGCYETFATEAQEEVHERRCMFKSCACLMLPCKWVGVLSCLAQHLRKHHGKKIVVGVETAHVVTLAELREKTVARFLQFAHGRLFIIEVHFRGQVVHAACQWIPEEHNRESQSDFVPLGTMEVVGLDGKPNSWRGYLQTYPSPFNVPKGLSGRFPCLSMALPWAYHARLSYLMLHVSISMIPESFVSKNGMTAPANSPASPDKPEVPKSDVEEEGEGGTKK